MKVKNLPFYNNVKFPSFMTRIKRQKFHQLRGCGYNKNCESTDLSWWNSFLPFYMCHGRWALHVVIKRKVFHIYV